MNYRSGLERSIAKLLNQKGVSFEYETSRLPYTLECNYIPDFLLPNGIYLEAKGLWEPDDRRKIKAVKLCHPNIDLRMVFQSPYNKIYKGSKTTYAQWCEKHDIPWCHYKQIPPQWLQ